MTLYAGGFYFHESDLVRTGHHRHTKALHRPISRSTLDALNAVQATPWRINTRVLDVLSEAYRSGSTLADVPDREDIEPPRKSDEDWDAMSEEERRDWKRELAEIHGTNAALLGRRRSLKAKIEIAEDLRDEPAIYFPRFLDFRSRIYPQTAQLTPQSDDLGRSLLTFAEAKPLGIDGWRWLCIRLAGTYGEDKSSLSDRVAWTQERIELIMDSADNPLDGQRWWAEAEEPWNCLATCFEITDALSSGDVETFESSLPIQVDGSCNGLQHLAALARDRTGAIATNVAANKERQDIYLETLRDVKNQVSHDAMMGVEEAIAWLDHLARGTVKRATMTTPYGVTQRGITTQLLEDGHTDPFEKTARGKHAAYLKDKIVPAIGRIVVSADQVMGWIQECAAAMSRYDIPLDFTTPAGTKVRQAYYRMNAQRVKTLVGRLNLWVSDKASGLDDKKQALASAPNVIHAFDAAHLAMTVNRMEETSSNPLSYSMIHDSYGTHAADMTAMSKALRDTFYEIYSEDWLQRLYDEWSAAARRANHPDIVPHYSERVEMGDFDITEVLESEYFFA